MNFDLNKAAEILIEELHRWLESGIKALPNLLMAILILVITALLASFIFKMSSSVFSRSTRNKAALQLVQKVLFVAVWSVGFFIALGVLNLDKTVTSLLAGAGVLGLALGFAFQEIAANFVSGVLIAFQEPYRIDDIVEVESYIGTVKTIELRSTTITTFVGLDVIVPNKDMYTKALINYTTTPRRRLDLEVGVSYSDDLRKIKDPVTKAIEHIPGRIASEPINVFFTEFGDSSINFVLQVWLDFPANNNYLRFRNEAIMCIKEAFDREGITIPFPMRTLDFDQKQLGELIHPTRLSAL
jgi:small conductance mechanosensitive channel